MKLKMITVKFDTIRIFGAAGLVGVLLFLGLSCALAALPEGQQKRTHCTISNIFPAGSCRCDLEREGSNTGFGYYTCDMLACEEFDTNSRPTDCKPGTRGVTCIVRNSEFQITCPMMAPRVDDFIDAVSFCNLATADLHNKQQSSKHYRQLEQQQCTPLGGAYPPARGWIFSGELIEGWN